LSGCFEEKSQPICYDIVNITNGQPNQPILINKCTGETWMTLREELPKQKNELTPSYILKWFKIDQGYGSNVVAGFEKPAK
jgi:hypothetical protein